MKYLLFSLFIVAWFKWNEVQSWSNSFETIDSKWPAIIAGMIFLYILGSHKSSDKNRKCVWCGHNDNNKLKFETGQTGEGIWEFRNKDGSRDKRVKVNFEKWSYISECKCKICGAKTKFTHFPDKKPSKDIKIWKGALIENGDGERKSEDFESVDRVSAEENSENRKKYVKYILFILSVTLWFYWEEIQKESEQLAQIESFYSLILVVLIGLYIASSTPTRQRPGIVLYTITLFFLVSWFYWEKLQNFSTKLATVDSNWPLGITILFSLYIIGKISSKSDPNKNCAWCGEHYEGGAGMALVSGETGEGVWNSSNKDGSQDKRVKNNFQLFPYLTVYKCRVCNAQTKFTHKYHKNPSEKVSVSKGVLLENGEGERKSENFSMSN